MRFNFFSVQQLVTLAMIFFCATSWCNPCPIIQEPIITLDTEYSNRFGWIINPRYTNSIDLYNALGIEIAFNPREYRMEATWVHQFSHNQRLKTTAEYLSQVLDLGFITGVTAQWTDQGAIAVLYQYLLPCSALYAIQLQSYYVHAHDEHYLAWPYDLGQSEFLNYRNIAGSRDVGVGLGMEVRLLPRAMLSMDLFYDAMKFNNHYEGAPNSGFGAAISCETILSQCLKSKILYSNRAIYNQFHADVSWLVLSKPGRQVELMLGYDYFVEPFIIKNESVVGIQLVWHWDNQCATRNYLSSLPQYEDNVRWARQPVVRFPQNIVMRDETLVFSRPLS